ncbi:MAG: cyclic nucleotide-binding domain-containing protein [Chthoniobacterales bacterium]|nr:cyclic nucleotide-binding domain-containing protein [Chthoniobacterales bacterium]
MTNEKTNMEERVAAHPFVAGMDAHQVKLLSQSAAPTEFQAGQVIFQAGDPANGFYLIESGRVVLQDRQPDGTSAEVDVVSAGEPLGWSWIFEPYRWQFDARATEPTRALCFSGILLRQHRDEDLMLSHEFFKRMCQVMVQRLQHARSRLVAQQMESPK